MHLHVQAAFVIMMAPYDGAGKDLVALLRVMCGMPTGSAFKWAFKVEIHPTDPNQQRSLRKVNKPGLFGYCLKQRFTSATFRCVLPTCADSPACIICVVTSLCHLHGLTYLFLPHPSV